MDLYYPWKEQWTAGGFGTGMEWIRENKILCKKIGIIVGVYLGMKYLVPLVIPFLLAGVIVCQSWPLLRWLKRRLHIRPPYVIRKVLKLFYRCK